MKLAWSTDLHINHAAHGALQKYVADVRAVGADALVLTGDTAESNSLLDAFDFLHSELGRLPIYFVLGNHDYYGNSISKTNGVASVIHTSRLATHLGAPAGEAFLTKTTALVGVGGWGDGRVGAFNTSPVLLADWEEISDFHAVHAIRDRKERLDLLHSLSDHEASCFRVDLLRALETHEHVYAAMHVPPFQEAAWHEGKPSDKHWAPWFVCKAVGDVLDEVAGKFPKKRIAVLCGHTHGGGTYQRRANLKVFTGKAQYGAPALTRIFDIE